MPSSARPVRVLYFAAARERAGVAQEQLDVGGRTVADVSAIVVERHPRLADVVRIARWAIDQRFVQSSDVVPAGAELALIPPVAGG